MFSHGFPGTLGVWTIAASRALRPMGHQRIVEGVRQTRIRVHGFGLTLCGKALALVEESGAFQPFLQRKRRIVGSRSAPRAVDMALRRAGSLMRHCSHHERRTRGAFMGPRVIDDASRGSGEPRSVQTTESPCFHMPKQSGRPMTGRPATRALPRFA